MRRRWTVRLFLAFLVLMLAGGASGTAVRADTAIPPVVTLGTAEALDDISAYLEGMITSSGGAPITACGFLLSKTNSVPTFADIHVTGYLSDGVFTGLAAILDPGTAYYVRAYATNSAATAYSDVSTFVTLLGVPEPVSVQTSETSATITWSAIAGADNYQLDLSEDPAFADAIVYELDVGPVLMVGVTHPRTDIQLYYRMRATSLDAVGEKSTPIAVFDWHSQTIDWDVLPAFRVWEAAELTLTATASSGLPVSYASSDPSVATVTGGVLRIVGSGTAVITASQSGADRWSAATDVTQTVTVAPLGLPIPVAFSPTAGRMALAWDAVDGAAGYVLDVAEDAAFVSPVAGQSGRVLGDVTSVSIDGLTPGGSYWFRVRAVCTVEDGAWSSPDSYTLPREQTITFVPFPEIRLGSGDLPLAGVSDSGLPLTYASSNPAVAMIGDGALRIVGPGVTVITATQAGDAHWFSAASVQRTLVVLPAEPIPDTGESSNSWAWIAGVAVLAAAAGLTAAVVAIRRKRNRGE